MFLSKELLKNYLVKEEILRLFSNTYPNGIELSVLLEDLNVPKDIIYWAESYLPLSTQELEDITKLLKIKNSTRIFHSHNIETSDLVSYSNNIYNSHTIRDCKYVDHSDLCYNSQDVNNSSFVVSSSMVDDSEYCVKSSNVDESKDISLSQNISNSSHIYASSFITDSIMVYNSEMVEKSYFSSNLKNCKRCLFSHNLNGKELYLFNAPISETVYNQVVRALIIKLTHETLKLYQEKEDLFLGVLLCPEMNFSLFFKDISQDFWTWVKTLPNFDGHIMYQIALRGDLLETKI